MIKSDYDYIIIGSGFGGSVSALRLSEKGYKVLVLEKGKWLGAKDFPKTNWNLKKWMWMPALGWFGLFKMTVFRHVAILSGVGVGGGSLVYANTLPVPKIRFYKAKEWAHLADWEKELVPFYQTALTMLGATTNPRLEAGDKALQQLAKEIGREEHFEKTEVGVFFGKPEVTVPDPYFKGEGPERQGCNLCGSCMTGCPNNAKNSLDKNYLHLARRKGATIQAESEVYDVIPNGEEGQNGYTVKWKSSTALKKQKGEFHCKGVIFSGGVLGTVELLLKLKKSSLPRLSNRVGFNVLTNSESLIPITSYDNKAVFSKGIAIGSILHTDENSHVEPVRNGPGNGFWRLLLAPMIHEKRVWERIGKLGMDYLKHPINNLRIATVKDWSRQTQIFMFMQTINSKLRFSLGTLGLQTSIDEGEPPTAFIPEAKELATQYARILNGKPTTLINETLLGIPTTAHILGGSMMGMTAEDGVIDKNNRVFGYDNMFVCDGSMISANPGVNPSLSITAISERAMSLIPHK
ncbi:GMC oxidoreductase [Deltaproteobacteria bacterium TL4]